MKRILIPLIIASLFYGWAVYKWHTLYNQAKPQAESELVNTAAIASTLIDGNAYTSMLSKKTIAKEDYDNLIDPLVKLHSASPNIAHIYTVSKLGPDLYSILDTGPTLYKIDPSRPYKYETGRIEKINTPDQGLEKAIQGATETYTLEPNRHSSGADIARYTPLFDKKGKQVGVLALTMNKEVAKKLQRDATEKLIIEIGLYTLLFAIMLSLLALRNAKIQNLELKCEATEDQFRTMVEKMPGAVYMFASRPKSDKGTLLMLSKSAEELLNVSPEEAERTWQELVDILPSSLKEAERGKVRQAKSTMSPWECEFRSPKTNVWLSNKATPRKDESGNINWFGSITDISAQKKESEKLEETNHILKQIGEAPDDPLTLNKICEFSVGKEDKAAVLYTNINGKLYPIAGSGIEEELGEIISNPREAGTSTGGPCASMVQSERLDISSLLESQFYSKAEDLRTALLSAGFKSSTCYPLIGSEDQCFGVLEILRRHFVTEPKSDVKEDQGAHLCLAGLERERNRRSLESNERRYRTLFESSPIGICEVNTKGDIFYTNASFDKIIDEKIFNEIKKQGMKEGKKEIIGEEKSLLAETTKIEKANGTHHYITFVSDISEQKEKEERAITSKELAEAANKAKSEFLAVMSHEIRTPLNGVIGFSQILETMDLAPKEKSFVSKIKQSGETLLATINDILSLSKIEAGRIDLEKRPFNIRRAVETSAEIIQPKAQEKGIYIKTEFNDIPDAIVGDETRVRQIIMNLVGNAVKFTESGGVTINATYQAQKMEIEVIDTGIGISEENQKKLFQPFSQADSSTTRKYGGTGLGLVICRKLAQLMGGSINLQSTESVGSRFTLSFPALVGQLNDEQAATPKQEEDLLPLSILVAEDDEVNRLVIFEMLKGLGHEIEFAKNGKEAVSKALELKDWTDVILMDMRMPEMDGLEATRAIRERERHKQWRPVPIFALTANAMEEDKNKCLQAGMTNYVSKPIDITILKKALAQCQKAKRKLIDIDKIKSKGQGLESDTTTRTEIKQKPLITKAKEKKEETIIDSQKINESENDNNTYSSFDKETPPTDELGDLEFGAIEDFGGFGEEETTVVVKEETKQSSDQETFLEESQETPTFKPIQAKNVGPSEEVLEETIFDEDDIKTQGGNEKGESQENESLEDIFSEWGFGQTDQDSVDEDIISIETLDACLEILPIERVSSVILPSITENCKKGVEIILSNKSTPKEKSNAAHKMCGSLGTFGCIALERAARSIESHYERDSSRCHEEDDLRNLVEKTLDTLRKTIDKKLRT